MIGLQELQASFRRSLQTGDNAIASHLAGSGQLAVSERLGIYQNAYRSRLVEALGKDYPVVQALFGEDAFTTVCHAYIDVHPSRSFSLRWLGQSMASFLSNTNYPPYFPELARFEWALVEAFDAADVVVAKEPDLTPIAPQEWPALKLRFHPSMQRLSCHWNILALWRAVRDKTPPPDPISLPQPLAHLVWREHLTTRYRTLEADETDAMEGAASGDSFAALCERLTRWHADEAVPLRAVSLLQRWLGEGLISKIL
ncbi:MAG: DNA-binding domain-containing protein [Gammaproteobacteria bacterium]